MSPILQFSLSTKKTTRLVTFLQHDFTSTNMSPSRRTRLRIPFSRHSISEYPLMAQSHQKMLLYMLVAILSRTSRRSSRNLSKNGSSRRLQMWAESKGISVTMHELCQDAPRRLQHPRVQYRGVNRSGWPETTANVCLPRLLGLPWTAK